VLQILQTNKTAILAAGYAAEMFTEGVVRRQRANNGRKHCKSVENTLLATKLTEIQLQQLPREFCVW